MNNIFYENVQYVNVNNEGFNNLDFVQIVSGVGKVRQSACYTLEDGEVLVGVLPEPLFSLTDRLNLMFDIEKSVSDITGKKVYVTLDTDLFISINKCKDDVTAKEIKKQIIIRNSARM